MNAGSRAAVLVQLVRELNKSGSWSGETHIQKAVFFLQDLMGVPLGFDFMLYKYGPFSFALRDELSALRADRLVKQESRLQKYGPSFSPDAGAEHLERRFPKTVAAYDQSVRSVARLFGDRDVSSLERLATALWVTKQESGKLKTVSERARRLRQLKPHVSDRDATEAVHGVDGWIAQAST